LGTKRFTAARLLLDFQPIDELKFELNLNGYADRGDEQAAQYFAYVPLANPARGVVIDAEPRALDNARQADWTNDPKPTHNNRFYQVALRGDYEFLPHTTLTSITSYDMYQHDQEIDPDGVALDDYYYHTTGELNSFSQEIRLGGVALEKLNYIVGGNYSFDHTNQTDVAHFLDATSAYQFTDTFAALGVAGFPPFFGFTDTDHQNFTNRAVFGNLDFDATSQFTFHAGLRYTRTDISFTGCTEDQGGGTLALGYQTVLNSIRGGVGLPPTTVPAGGCVNISAAELISTQAHSNLNQSNVSWRTGVDFKPTAGTLFYGSVSKAYKSGSYPLLPASDIAQFDPVTQESVLAYEIGSKSELLDRKLQLQTAIFYYDYRDKQIKGRSISNPNIFGPLERLFNVPKSSIKGAEIQIDVHPFSGLTASLGATYLDSRVTGDFVNFDSYGKLENFAGSAFPYTPRFQLVADVQYDMNVNSKLNAFAGSNITYQTRTAATLGPQTDYASAELNERGGLSIEPYALVGVRAGVHTANDKLRVSLYANNLLDRYYWTNATRILDTSVRYAGMPRTYGVVVSVRY
jgi:iron complex outermembrane receptor protein